jgi:multidrug transporter EmrE-like cation transporter
VSQQRWVLLPLPAPAFMGQEREMVYRVLLFVGVLFSVVAQFVLKYGMQDFQPAKDLSQPLKVLAGIVLNPYVVLSATFYGCSFIIYSLVLSKLELSSAYPVATCSAIILVSLFSALLFHETFTTSKVLGLIFTMAGIYLIIR